MPFLMIYVSMMKFYDNEALTMDSPLAILSLIGKLIFRSVPNRSALDLGMPVPGLKMGYRRAECWYFPANFFPDTHSYLNF